ncbi:unnamed protein product [Mytilus coruscus]|uniref:DUF4371 domain-containing protein n=1 Tax=Mytilus coruscus TaxID=42192 RepID=A0A6J8B5S1_MYTCO|nr:unnamed protein product [Mytilus coruscus]
MIVPVKKIIKRDMTGFPYRHLFHQQFNPRDCQVLASDQPIYILWSVDAGLPNGPFTPNHFVSICLRTNTPVNNTLAEKNKKRKGNLTDYFMSKRTKPATLQSDENASEKGDPLSDKNAAEKRESVNYLTDDHMVSSTTAPGAELIVIIIIPHATSCGGRQGLPLRGRADDSDSNSNQLNVLRCEDNPNFREWLVRKSEKFTSPEIQNELLKIMSQILVRGNSEDIRNSLYFALMADETTDVSNREQLVVCIRWIDEQLEVHEDFIGLYQIDDTCAKTISDSIQDVLLRLNISLSQCRGQTYDGASAISGPKSGVQKRIKDEQPKALYNHCYGHRLNLACSDSIKRVKIVCDALDTTQKITKLVKKSPQRDTQL